MRVTLLQQDVVWQHPQANQLMAERAIEAAPASDLYVLPEMWDTGFCTDGSYEAPVAEEHPSLRWMHEMAQRLDATVAGSVAVRTEDGTVRNRFYFVTPESCGEWYYDKHHLFTYGGEQRVFTPGQERRVVEWRGVRFLLLTCYDLRFPTWSRNRGAVYDCILYVASWPASRLEAWRILLKARAIENQCYVCGVNRVGDDPQCHYAGASAVVDAYGKSEELTDSVGQLSVDIDMERLLRFRAKFPVLSDCD